MAIPEVFTAWFPVLFVSSFLITALAYWAHERGYFKPEVGLGKSSAIGFLLILGFNSIIFLPVIIIIMILNGMIGPSLLLDTMAVVMMSLSYLIPSLFSGVISYDIMKRIFDRWGTATAGLIASGLLFILAFSDVLGWLAPAIPWIMQSIIEFVNMELGMSIVLVLLAVCLSRLVPNSSAEPAKERTTRSTTNAPSREKSLQLLAGLGKRIVIDGSYEALEILRQINGTVGIVQVVLSKAGKDVGIELSSSLSGSDIQFAQQELSPLSDRFGCLTKRVRNIFVSLLVCAFVSAVFTAWSVYLGYRDWFFLLFPAIILPVIVKLAYDEVSSYRLGRYVVPPVNHHNSFLLTDAEFTRKSLVDKVRLLFSLAVLLGTIGLSLLQLAVSPIWMLFALLLMAIVAVLANRDRVLALRRLAIHEAVARGLEYLGLKPDEIESEVSVDETRQPAMRLPFEQTNNPVDTPVTSDSWKDELTLRGHSAFVEKIDREAREVYGEQVATTILIAIGGLLIFVGFLTWEMALSLELITSLAVFSVALIIAGVPVLAYGAFQYVKLRPSSRFHGLTRKQLTAIVSLLDQAAMGIEDFGVISDRDAPSEYQAFGMTRAFKMLFLRPAIIRTHALIPWGRDYLEAAWRTRSSYPQAESAMFVISTAAFYLMYIFLLPASIPYTPDFLVYIFLSLAGAMALLSVYSIFTYYREKKLLSMVVTTPVQDDRITAKDTLDILLNLLNSGFEKPLRVLLVGDYPQPAYTGRMFITTSGVKVREAVIMPH